MMTFCWSGCNAPYLDTPTVTRCGQVTLGRYGGATAAGARKNEDAALIWTTPDNDWTVAALLDAHGSSESAELALGELASLDTRIEKIMSGGDTVSPLGELSALIARHLGDADFRTKCEAVRGETALLICAQKGAYLWWLSIGDIPVYVFHPDFARLNQFALNQRMFFEWVGQVNTFALPIPCYASGVRQLRAGRTTILLTTDGLLECGTRRFEKPQTLYDLFHARCEAERCDDALRTALEVVQTAQGRDSASVITWQVKVAPFDALMQPTA